MSAVDEARALLARQQEREIECAERAVERNELPCRPVLDMPPALLAALCAEVEDLRAADAAHERRHALSERGDGYADRVIADLRAERDALRADAELARRYREACARTDAASEADEAAQTEASGAARKEAWIAQGRALDALVRGEL